MADTWARERVACAWWFPATGTSMMDADLADAFAEILQAEVEAAVRWGWNQIGAMTEDDVIARYRAKRSTYAKAP